MLCLRKQRKICETYASRRWNPYICTFCLANGVSRGNGEDSPIWSNFTTYNSAYLFTHGCKLGRALSLDFFHAIQKYVPHAWQQTYEHEMPALTTKRV